MKKLKKIKDQKKKIKKLKDNINKINQNKINEIEKYKSEIEKLKIENEKLKSDLFKANKIISGIQNNQIDNNEIKKLKDENKNLKNQLNLKDKEIKDLQLKIQNNVKIDKPKYDIDDIMVVTFMSQDSTINEGMKCLSTDVFAEVEEKLYKKYDNLRNTNNMFTANAKPVLRFIY